MKKLTKQANLTKKQVANYLNITLSEYIDLENNPQKLTLTTANQLSKLYCVPIHSFIKYINGKINKLDIFNYPNNLTNYEMKELSNINQIILNQKQLDEILTN